MKHTLSLLAENSTQCLTRITGLFTGKGFDIDTITVGRAEDPDFLRITLVCHGDDKIIEQVTKQLNKLIEVIKVVDLTEMSYVHRELALIKVDANELVRSEIMQIVEVFRGKIIDISSKTLTVECTGSEDKIEAIISMLRPFGLKEVARTGRIALKREYQGEI